MHKYLIEDDLDERRSKSSRRQKKGKSKAERRRRARFKAQGKSATGQTAAQVKKAAGGAAAFAKKKRKFEIEKKKGAAKKRAAKTTKLTMAKGSIGEGVILRGGLGESHITHSPEWIHQILTTLAMNGNVQEAKVGLSISPELTSTVLGDYALSLSEAFDADSEVGPTLVGYDAYEGDLVLYFNEDAKDLGPRINAIIKESGGSASILAEAHEDLGEGVVSDYFVINVEVSEDALDHFIEQQEAEEQEADDFVESLEREASHSNFLGE